MLRNYPFVLPLLAASVGAVAVAVTVAAPSWRVGHRRRAQRNACDVLLVATVALIGVVTFVYGNRLVDVTATGELVRGHSLNLRPLTGVRLALENADQTAGMLNLFGNVALFVPLGLLLALRFRLSVLVVVVLGLTASVGIEVGQYYAGRIADVDDVLLNTTGAAFGGATAWVVRRSSSGRVGL